MTSRVKTLGPRGHCGRAPAVRYRRVMDWLTTLTTALAVGAAVGYFDRLRDVTTGSRVTPVSWRAEAATETRRTRWRTSRNKAAEPTSGTQPSGTSFRRARR